LHNKTQQAVLKNELILMNRSLPVKQTVLFSFEFLFPFLHTIRIFGPKKVEVTGEWRKLHNEELHNLYSSPDIIRQVKSRRMRWAGHVARMGEERKVYKVLMGKPEGRRPLGRPRCRWEDGIRMHPGEIGLGGVDWIQLAQDRDQWRAVVSAVMNLRVLVYIYSSITMIAVRNNEEINTNPVSLTTLGQTIPPTWQSRHRQWSLILQVMPHWAATARYSSLLDLCRISGLFTTVPFLLLSSGSSSGVRHADSAFAAASLVCLKQHKQFP
jgi:hypothetical protein